MSYIASDVVAEAEIGNTSREEREDTYVLTTSFDQDDVLSDLQAIRGEGGLPDLATTQDRQSPIASGSPSDNTIDDLSRRAQMAIQGVDDVNLRGALFSVTQFLTAVVKDSSDAINVRIDKIEKAIHDSQYITRDILEAKSLEDALSSDILIRESCANQVSLLTTSLNQQVVSSSLSLARSEIKSHNAAMSRSINILRGEINAVATITARKGVTTENVEPELDPSAETSSLFESMGPSGSLLVQGVDSERLPCKDLVGVLPTVNSRAPRQLFRNS